MGLVSSSATIELARPALLTGTAPLPIAQGIEQQVKPQFWAETVAIIKREMTEYFMLFLIYFLQISLRIHFYKGNIAAQLNLHMVISFHKF